MQAAKTADGPSVAIVGVTGAVGQEFLRVNVPLVSECEAAYAVACSICLVCCALDLCMTSNAFLQVIKARDFPYSSLKMLASGRYH